MRSFLVAVDSKPCCNRRLDAALDLARGADGHLTVLIDTPMSRYLSMDPMGGGYIIADALDQARADDDAIATATEDRLARGDVPFDIVRSEDDLPVALADAGLLADLIVVSREDRIAGELALSTRTPVLVLGEGALALPIRRACIGWDGSEQSAVALRAAVPLLRGCQMVKVLTVTEKSGGFPATDALRYLSRHGIHAELEETPRRGSTEETLAVAVAGAHAELLVMGAYGKSRLREILFGGVTAYFLDEKSAPHLLLAH